MTTISLTSITGRVAALLFVILAGSGCSENQEVASEAPVLAGPATALPADHPPLTTNPAPATPGTPTGRSVQVSVSLSPTLRAKATPNDALFIFARAAQGPAMPLAIVRKQVKDLPVTVTLDDSMAMMPDFRMSNFPELIIGARVSKSGDAIAKPGDLEGYTSPLKSGTAEVVIASVVGTATRPVGQPPRSVAPPSEFNHATSVTKTRLNIPAEVKAKWKSTELALTGKSVAARTAKVAIGGDVDLDQGLVLRVLAYVPAFQSESGTVTSASNQPENPAVLVQLLEKTKVLGEGWVFQKLPDFNTFASDRIQVKLLGASG